MEIPGVSWECMLVQEHVCECECMCQARAVPKEDPYFQEGYREHRPPP